MEKISNKRIEWIDICKGLGIFLVVIGHTGISKASPIAYDWIYSFHMPFFYMLSGVVLNEQKYDTFEKFIKRRLKTLVIPFFILNTILFCIAKALDLNNVQPPLSELFTGVLAMYFLRVLFISEIFYFCINRISTKLYRKIIAIIILIYLNLYIQGHYDTGYAHYIMPGMPLLYYGIGNIFKTYIKQYAEILDTHNLVIIICISLIFSLSIIISHIKFLFIDIILAISGIFTLLSIGILCSKMTYKSIKEMINYIGKNTLVIVAFHQIIYNGLTLITNHIQLSAITDSGVRMLSVWILLFLICKFFNRYIPLAIGKSK
jgi:acyltransferase